MAPAHRWGHFLYEIRDNSGTLIAKVASAPEFIETVLGVPLGKQTSLTKQPAGETREPLANAGA